MLYPNFCFTHVTDIQRDFFDENNIKTILLDIDGTLAPHNHPAVTPALLEWVVATKSDRKIILFSNNNKKRVEDFAEILDTPFFFNVRKPGQKFFREIKKVEDENICIIGDQIFTDVLGGNIAGLITILVKPVQDKPESLFMKIKRALEKPFRKAKRKK